MSVEPTRQQPPGLLEPRGWPSAWTLAGTLLVLLLTKFFSWPIQLAGWPIYLLAGLLAVKIQSNLNARHELLKLFDKGDVPSVANKSIFSGNMFEIIAPVNNYQIIDGYHKKLGKIYGFFYGPDPWVQCSDVDLLQRIFVTEGQTHVDRTFYQMPFVDEWNDSLNQMKTDNVYEDVSRACQRFLGCIEGHLLRKSAEAGEQDYRIVNVLYNAKKLAIDVVCRLAFGADDLINMEPEQKDPLIEAIDGAAPLVMSPIDRIGIMFHELQRPVQLLMSFSDIGRRFRFIHATLNKSVEARRRLAGKLQKHERKMIDTLIECSDSNKMRMSELRANLFFFLVAGLETSANTLTCLFWLLARDQTLQDKLRGELLREGDQSEYLDWCLKETLRLYPAVPNGIGRILNEDLEYKGMKFFKGTTVNASIYSIHHSAEYWGDDPETFRPERFGQLKLHPAQYFAFGLGPRNCVGAHLAMSELRSVLTQVLLRFRLETCDDTPDRVNFITPNIIQMIIDSPLNIKFIRLKDISSVIASSVCC